MKCSLLLVFCMLSGVIACSTTPPPQKTTPPVKTTDLFEPMRQPYLQAFHAARLGDKYQTKASVQRLLEVLEVLRSNSPERWPSPYKEEVQLTQKALELLVNQVKVVGVLNITGQHQEAYSTLLDVGYVLKRVRRHLGVVRPTDHMLGVHRALEQIKGGLEAPTMDWANQQQHVEQIQAHIQTLKLLPASDWPASCNNDSRWNWITALSDVVTQRDRLLLQSQWKLARRQFYQTFQSCG